MRGFKEDFEAWRGSLTPEERKLVQTQAQNEFNKKFRKSDDFKKDLPEEKLQSFSKVLSKFFDAEAEDYKKEVEAKVPNYNRLLEKAGDKVMDFAMTGRVVEIDRDADRRYMFATRKDKAALEKGEYFPQSSPMLDIYEFENESDEQHEGLKAMFEALKKKSADVPELKDVLAEGLPAKGERFIVQLPMALTNQLMLVYDEVNKAMDEMKENRTEAEIQQVKERLPEVWAGVINQLTENYVSAHDEVEKDVENMKAMFRSQSKDRFKTKADVLRSIMAELPKHTKNPVPPIDEEFMAELEALPAYEGTNIWGTADKLYKSEAIDAFGMKYLLGIFETQEEAEKAFTVWNTEYEKGRADQKVEMAQWSKQENARLDADTSGKDRITKILEEARR
jgi:hypothetical protein